MNSVFTFDHFRFASYLRIAFISYEYGFVAVVWPSSVSESCQNFCLRFEWVTSRPRCRPQLTRTNYNLPFFFYRNDCLILVFKSSTNYFFFVRKKSEKSGAGTKLWACLHVNQNKRVNCINYKELNFIHLFSNSPLFLCEGSFFVLSQRWKRKTSMGRKSINYISIPGEVKPPNDLTAMKNECKDWIEILLPSAFN